MRHMPTCPMRCTRMGHEWGLHQRQRVSSKATLKKDAGGAWLGTSKCPRIEIRVRERSEGTKHDGRTRIETLACARARP